MNEPHEILPTELLHHVMFFLSQDRDSMAALACVNKRINEATKIPRWGYGLFTENYKRGQGSLPPILKLAKITPFHFRQGNKLVNEAMELLAKGDLEKGKRTIITAMCTHGSSRAIKLYEMMGQLGCHFKKVPNLNLSKQIKTFEKYERLAIEKDINENFNKEDVRKHLYEIYKNICHQRWHLNEFVKSFRIFFERKKWDATANFTNIAAKNLRLDIDALECLYPPPKSESLQADYYLGVTKHAIEKTWYSKNEKIEQEQFEKMSPYLT